MRSPLRRTACSIRGGVFIYPFDPTDADRPGRLRLLHEANPIAMIVEQAHGAASSGRGRILDRLPARCKNACPRSSVPKKRCSGSSGITRPSIAAKPHVRDPACLTRARSSGRANHVGQTSGHRHYRLLRRRHDHRQDDLRQIFRRENVTPAVVEGDAFHRYDRNEMRDDDRRSHQGRPSLQPFRPRGQSLRRVRDALSRLRRNGQRPDPQIPPRREEAAPYNQAPARLRRGKTSSRNRLALLRGAARGGRHGHRRRFEVRRSADRRRPQHQP